MPKTHAEEGEPIGTSQTRELSNRKQHSMLRSIKQLYGETLGTAEGEIGHVRDIYFDDQKWTVRYVVADTGGWLPGRLVLLSPHAFGSFHQDGDALLVNLLRRQIEDSPAIETHKPISRQYEETYYRYYGWPAYWEGAGMWGMGGFPIAPPPHLVPIGADGRKGGAAIGDDPHLRSTKAITGYHIQTAEGEIGHITDFMIDDKSWAIRYLVVETGHWFFGKEIVISPHQIDRISYEDSKVFVSATKRSLQNASKYRMPRAVYHDSHNFDD